MAEPSDFDHLLPQDDRTPLEILKDIHDRRKFADDALDIAMNMALRREDPTQYLESADDDFTNALIGVHHLCEKLNSPQ